MVFGVACAFFLTVFAVFAAPVVGEAEDIEDLFSPFRFGNGGAVSFLLLTQAILNGDFEVEEDSEFPWIEGLVGDEEDGASADPVEVGDVFGLSDVVGYLRFHESKVAPHNFKATQKVFFEKISFVNVA